MRVIPSNYLIKVLKNFCLRFMINRRRRRRRRRRRLRRHHYRLKDIHSRSDTSRIGAEGLSFYYPRLLYCLNQMLAVVL